MYLKFPDNYFCNEIRCDFHITAMMKRVWAVQMDILSWIDEVCRENDINYIACWGSMLGAVRHKGFIPWDDDIDIGMLRGDYEKFLTAVDGKLPPFFSSKTLLPGAGIPKEMVYTFSNGTSLNTSPEFLERFYGCPYVTGIDVYVFDKIPNDPEDFAYQERLIKLLDKLLLLQRDVDGGTMNSAKDHEYRNIRNTVERELDFSFDNARDMTLQIVTLIDMACALCEDCDSENVEIREQMIYRGSRHFRTDHFTDRVRVPFEGIMEVPIPEKYGEFLEFAYGKDWKIPRKFESRHDYPIYHEQREILYKLYNERNWTIPEEFLEYDENGKLIVDPKEL